MTYREYKIDFIKSSEACAVNINDGLFAFCESLSATEYRWFKTTIREKEVVFEVQDGGTHWKLIQFDHADQFTLSIGGLSQYVVFYANPITQEEFTRILKQAMWRLLRTSK